MSSTPDYSSSQAALRIRRVQLLCKQNGLDGVLLVPGVDGSFSVCNQAVGYVLAGRSNRDTIDVVKLDDQLDEVVALITPTDVCVYVPDPELRYLLQELLTPFVASFRLLGPTKVEAEDADMLEENKLASFVHMLRGCRRLGIPCGLAAASQHRSQAATANGGPPQSHGLPQLAAGQLVALEKWPLLQAYGLEGVGRSGFFTMNFEVYDMEAALLNLYGELDARSLAVLLGEAVPTLRQHWDEMLQALGGKAAGQRGGLSEKQVVEPLAGYFAYGLLRPVAGVEQAVTMPPRAVFGPRSADDSAGSEATPLVRCGPAPGSPPLHLVVEAADPRSPLRAARTYFLSRGVAERNVFADLDEEAEKGYSFEAATAGWRAQADDVVYLMRLYAALMEAARAAMAHFAAVEGATAHSAKAEAQEVLARRAEQLGVATGGGASLAARLRFALCQIDHANHVTTPAVPGSRHLKVLRLSLPEVTCRSGPLAGKLLGGLVYGDTFIDVPTAGAAATQRQAPAQQQGKGGAGAGAGGGGGGGSRHRVLLVLTEGVAPLLAIPAGGYEEDLAARALRSLAKVVESAAGGGATTRAADLALQRDRERRAAGAAAESQALAARRRALRSGSSAADVDDELDEPEDEGDDVDAAAGSADSPVGGPSAAATAAVPRQNPAEALGRLLTLGGGDDAVLLTGAAACPALVGTLYCFAAGLVFVEGVSRAVWVLDLRRPNELQSVIMQQLPRPRPTNAVAALATANGARSGSSASPSGASDARGGGGGGSGAGLGEAVVFRGASPACGLPPACHLTTNTHLALALSSMSPAARRFVIQSVLPAWQQTCREAAAAAAESGASAAASYLKDMGAPNPFPLALHAAHSYAVQTSAAGGGVKSWPGVMAEDDIVTDLLAELDEAEMSGALSGIDPAIEALLLQGPPPSSSSSSSSSGSSQPGTRGGPGGSLTLVVGLPGSEQAAAAAAVAAMLGDEAAAVALLPQGALPLRPADFQAALSAAAAAARPVRHLVLATSSYLGLFEQLRMLAAAAVGGAGGRWWLSSVVVACNADTVYEEPGRRALAAGVMEQLAPGFVDCVVLGGSDTVQVASLAQLVSERLPDVPQIRSGRTQLLRAREELLPKQADRVARLTTPQAAAARRWAPLLLGAAVPSAGVAAGDVRAGSSGGGLLGPLQASVVVFEGALDVSKLRDALAEFGVPQAPDRVPALPLADAVHTPGAAVPGLVAVRGCARLVPAGRPSELLGSRGAGLRAREWPLADTAVVHGGPRLPADEKLPGGELLFVGTGSAVQEQALRRLLERCGARQAQTAGPLPPSGSGSGSASSAEVPVAAVPRTAADLTRAQRALLREAHLFDPLPEGYCFNGTQYFDAFGDASLEHPDMDRFIAEWLHEQHSKAATEAAGQASLRPVVLRVMGPVAL